MYSPDSLKIFTKRTSSLRFPISKKKPYKILMLPENCDVVDIYQDLNILKSDIRIYSNPKFKVGGKVILSNAPKIKLMKNLGMTTYAFIKQVDKAKRNCIIDLTQYSNMIKKRLNNNFTSPRATMLFNSGLGTFASSKDFYNTLIYVIDIRKPFEVSLNRRLAWIPIFHNLRHNENIPYIDSMILCLISESGKPTYVKIFDKHEKIQYARSASILKAVKVSNKTLENFGDDIAKKIKIEDKSFDNISTKLKTKSKLNIPDDKTKNVINESISNYVESKPDKANKVLSTLNDKSDNIENELRKNAMILAMIKYKMTNDEAKFESTTRTIDKYIHMNSKDKEKLRKLNEGLILELGKYVERSSSELKVVNHSLNPTTKNINIEKLLDHKTPKTIVENKQTSFNYQLFNDLVKLLKTFKHKEYPLTLVDYSLDTKHDVTDIKDNKFVSFKFTMKDENGKFLKNEILIPYIDKFGNMTINGLNKVMVGQLMLKPIYFPEKHICKISTFFSTIQLQYRLVREKGYAIAYVTGMVVPIYLLYSLLFKRGLDDVFSRLGYSRKDLIITKEASETRKAKKENPKWFIQFDNNEYLFFPSKIMESSEIAKTFYHSMKLINYTARHVSVDQFLDNDYQSEILIIVTGKKNAPFNIKSFFNGFLDPISLELIEDQGYPTKLEPLLWKCTELIHTDKEDRRTDLTIQRFRTTETFLHIIYKQLLMAYNVYKNKKLIGYNNAEFELKPDYVFKQIVNTQLIRGVENVNPIEELAAATRMTYVGIGGVANKNGVPERMRIVDDTYYGTIDAIDTPEGGSNIGMLQHATVDAMLTDSRGSFKVKKLNNESKTGISSVSSVMTPFSNHDDGARLMMAANQVRQSVPLINKEIPLVQTGYETALTTFLSESFLKKTQFDGIVKSIDDFSIVVESTEKKSKGKKQVIDLNPHKLTSGMTLHTLSYFQPTVKVGQKVKRYQMLAEGASIKSGTISLGTNLLIAYMPYHGANHDDSIIMSKKASESVKSKHIETFEIHILPNSKVLEAPGIKGESIRYDVTQKLLSINDGVEYKKGDILLSYIPHNIAESIELNPGERIYSGGVIKIKTPYTGKLIDVKIYANDDINLYPKLKQLHMISREKHNTIYDGSYKSKGEKFKGILVNLIFEYEESGLNLGDKYANRHGNKGVIALPSDEMPITPWGQPIDMIYNPLGVIGRMNPGQLFETYLGLIGWKVKQLIMQNPSIKKTVSIITKVYYNILDKSIDKIISKTVIKTIKSMSKPQFQRFLDMLKTQKGYAWIYPTYMTPSMQDINKALKVLDLKDKYILDLPMYGPDIKTKVPVPVGYAYIYKMEHVSSHKISSRSVGRYQNKSMQPTTGKKAKGGQRVGEFDSWSLFSHGATNLIKEMFGPLSDDMISKNEFISNIIENGYTHNIDELRMTPTRDLMEVYFRLMLIDFNK